MSQIIEGKPLCAFTNVTSGQQLEVSVDGDVSDGQWHVLQLRRRGSYLTLSLDDRPVVNRTNITITHSALLVEAIFLGTAPLTQSRDQNLGKICVCFVLNFYGGKLSHVFFTPVLSLYISTVLVIESDFFSLFIA